MFCPECATENDLHQGYCRNCGLALAGAPLALERRFEKTLADFEAARASLRKARAFTIGALIWAVFSALFILSGESFMRELASLVVGICLLLAVASVFVVKGFSRIQGITRRFSAVDGANAPVLGRSGGEGLALPETSAAAQIDLGLQGPSVTEHTTLDLSKHQRKE